MSATSSLSSCDSYFEEADFPSDIQVDRELYGVPPPEHVHFPTGVELVKLCRNKHPRAILMWPREQPVFWIKYGTAVYWNEFASLSLAYTELQRLGSEIRVPAVYYACEYKYRIFVVMEYIAGQTVRQRFEVSQTLEESNHIVDQVALCMSELHRIPVSQASRPAAVDKGLIRHRFFSEGRAPRHYENVEQLETHLNRYLEGTNLKRRIEKLALEPMVFCYSDLYPDNFMIDSTGRPTVIDFADVSILPASFAKLVLRGNKLPFEISEKVWVPSAIGVDNTLALDEGEGRMPMGWAYFARVGTKLPGGDRETQDRVARISAAVDR